LGIGKVLKLALPPRGAKLNIRDHQNKSPLMTSILHGNVEVMNHLLKYEVSLILIYIYRSFYFHKTHLLFKMQVCTKRNIIENL